MRLESLAASAVSPPVVVIRAIEQPVPPGSKRSAAPRVCYAAKGWPAFCFRRLPLDHPFLWQSIGWRTLMFERLHRKTDLSFSLNCSRAKVEEVAKFLLAGMSTACNHLQRFAGRCMVCRVCADCACRPTLRVACIRQSGAGVDLEVFQMLPLRAGRAQRCCGDGGRRIGALICCRCDGGRCADDGRPR